MSGPKGIRVFVVSSVELRRREDEARSARCDQLSLQLSAVATQLTILGQSLPVDVTEPAVRTHEALVEWEQSLRDALTAARDKARTESAREVARLVERGERAGSIRGLDASGVRLGVSGPVDSQEIIGMLGDLRDDLRRSELAHRATRVFEAVGQGATGRDVVAIRRDVEAALEVQRLRDLAAESMLTVAHIVTPHANRMRARAEAVSTMEELAAIQAQVRDLQAQATRASDAEFIQHALCDVLSELGYTIGEGFQLEDLGRSFAIGDHEDHQGYGIRVQINPQNRMLYTRLVADGETSPEADAQAEADSCAKVLAIANNLEGAGVAAELVFERQPGDAPLERRATTSRRGRRRKMGRGRAGGTRSV